MLDAIHGTLIAPGSRSPIDEARVAAAGYLAGFRGRTRESYAANLRAWVMWCDANDVPILGAARPHVELYARELEEVRGRALATVSLHLTTIIGFYKYAIAEGFIEGTTAIVAKRPQLERVSRTNSLSRTEFAAVLALAEKSPSPRDLALLCLMGYGAMRVAEVCGIDIEALSANRWTMTVTILRKGGKTQTQPMAPRTAWAVAATRGDRTSGPLFLTRGGNRMNRQDVNRVVKKYCRKIGVTKRVSPHSLRHTAVSLAIDAGASERDIMNMTGHSDPRMIPYYDRHRDPVQHNATHELALWVEGAA